MRLNLFRACLILAFIWTCVRFSFSTIALRLGDNVQRIEHEFQEKHDRADAYMNRVDKAHTASEINRAEWKLDYASYKKLKEALDKDKAQSLARLRKLRDEYTGSDSVDYVVIAGIFAGLILSAFPGFKALMALTTAVLLLHPINSLSVAFNLVGNPNNILPVPAHDVLLFVDPVIYFLLFALALYQLARMKTPTADPAGLKERLTKGHYGR